MPRATTFIKIILLSLVSTFGCAQGSFDIAFWNVENLFDTTNAPYIQDDDFTPTGRYEWNEERLEKKIIDLSQVILDLDSREMLAMVGLAEIENRHVLDRLNQKLGRGFKVIHKESPDERGIDCGLLYNPDLVKLIAATFIPIYLAGEEKTRDIIEARFKSSQSSSGKELYVFVNHWPSRWGGQAETEPLRFQAATTLRKRIDVILRANTRADIIILGDFNDYPSDPSLRRVLRASAPEVPRYPGDLINTTWPIHAAADQGTVMYRGDWTVLDQIIISEGLLMSNGFLWETASTQAFKPEYLIEQDGKYSGWPFRMYRGSEYQGGYSDHLPVFCKVRWE